MLTLALDTSTTRGGVAILRGSKLLAQKIWEREKSHSELVTSELADCLKQAGIRLKDLNRLCVGQGPGSFTGIRIAVNAVRTLAYSLALPVYAYDTTQILAAGVPVGTTPLLTLVSAHRNLLYVSRFVPEDGEWKRTARVAALPMEAIEKLHANQTHVCIGEGYQEFSTAFSSATKSLLLRDSHLTDQPSPEILGRMPETWKIQPYVWNQVQALYIRASEAEEKLREGSLRERIDTDR